MIRRMTKAIQFLNGNEILRALNFFQTRVDVYIAKTDAQVEYLI